MRTGSCNTPALRGGPHAACPCWKQCGHEPWRRSHQACRDHGAHCVISGWHQQRRIAACALPLAQSPCCAADPHAVCLLPGSTVIGSSGSKASNHVIVVGYAVSARSTTSSACSVAVSYKPPMLVTRARLPACAYLLQSNSGLYIMGWG